MLIEVKGVAVPVFEVFALPDIVTGNGAEVAILGAGILKDLQNGSRKNIKLFTINKFEFLLIDYTRILGSKGKLINVHLYSNKWLDKELVAKVKKYLYQFTDGSRIKIKSHPIEENNGKYITIRVDENFVSFNNIHPRPFSAFTYESIKLGTDSYSADDFINEIAYVNSNKNSYYFVIHLGEYDAYMLIPKNIINTANLKLSIYVPNTKFELAAGSNIETIKDNICKTLESMNIKVPDEVTVEVLKGGADYDEKVSKEVEELFNSLNFFNNSYDMFYNINGKHGIYSKYTVLKDGISSYVGNIFIPKHELSFRNIEAVFNVKDNFIQES